MKKILVGLKRVIDYNVRVRVKSDGTGVESAFQLLGRKILQADGILSPDE